MITGNNCNADTLVLGLGFRWLVQEEAFLSRLGGILVADILTDGY